jgi:hypothetical protein
LEISRRREILDLCTKVVVPLVARFAEHANASDAEVLNWLRAMRDHGAGRSPTEPGAVVRETMKEKKTKRWCSHSPTQSPAKRRRPRQQPKPKRPSGIKRWLEHQRRLERAAERKAEHDRFAKGRWAAPSTKNIRVRSVVSGGLPSLGKKR